MLRSGRLSVQVGKQFARCQGIRIVEVHIQGMHQGRTFLHNPDAGMFVSMNAAFVPLGLAKPAFQVEIVARLVRVVTAYE